MPAFLDNYISAKRYWPIVLLSIFLSVLNVEVCGKLSDNVIIKIIQDDEKSETLLASEENSETVERSNNQTIIDYYKKSLIRIKTHLFAWSIL